MIYDIVVVFLDLRFDKEDLQDGSDQKIRIEQIPQPMP